MKQMIRLCALLLGVQLHAQDISTRLENAYTTFTSDPQLKSALVSLYVIDAATGQPVFDRNSTIGMATASTLKIVTSATAYELLGRDFRYRTLFLDRTNPHGAHDLVVNGSGDPTFGSWRYPGTKDSVVLRNLVQAIRARGRGKDHFANVVVNDVSFDPVTIPRGYIWEDIGNYYGAGLYQLNWHENQYDLAFRTQAPGSTAVIASMYPALDGVTVDNFVQAGAEGSGDNSYIYFEPGKNAVQVRGTVPPNRSTFTISGALPDPPTSFARQLQNRVADHFTVIRAGTDRGTPATTVYSYDTVYIHRSPALDSIVYWFLKKSINLYGEALLRTLAYQKDQYGSMQAGIALVRAFWKEHGIDPVELNLADGSGLSPLNRVTTHAQVMILQYAQKRSWFDGYYNAFPEYNGMKMKSGTISGVKGFCGYQRSKDGHQYIFSFLVNNYNGAASALINKMYRVLDELK